MSAGGHLSLVLGTMSDEGKADDKDPVERVSDRVQAVVAYVAPTDLTIMVREHTDRLPAYDRFPALNLDLANAKKFSPLLEVTPDDPPTLLLAGAKDDLVPVDHNRRIHAALDEKKVVNKLVEYDAGHGFGPDVRPKAVEEMVAWFEKYLAK
jgi:dipeptidyl aminopeptidase/acylaminoacyl peptidase